MKIIFYIIKFHVSWKFFKTDVLNILIHLCIYTRQNNIIFNT